MFEIYDARNLFPFDVNLEFILMRYQNVVFFAIILSMVKSYFCYQHAYFYDLKNIE